MIRLANIQMEYPTRNGIHKVLNDVSLSIKRGQKVGILGRNGSGKSTLIRLLGGIEQPTRGQIMRSMTVSWPLAFQGGFQIALTGLDNLRFICRIYGVDYKKVLQFVEEFAELGEYFREPVKKYSSGMFARLGFAISMAIEFDCYLIDEVLAVGDSRFHEKCHHELFEKRADRAMVLVSHQPGQIKKLCNTFYVLHNGAMEQFDDPDAAYTYYAEQG